MRIDGLCVRSEANMQAAAKVILPQIRILASTPTSARKFLVTDAYGRGAHTLAGDAMVQTIFSGLHDLSPGARVWDGARWQPGV
uniref:Uncharacterized protein n=1 Tax=Ganoderma boninense TaxID=34458 RepID=A0A5K1K1F3_9APHY|nr:Uncharacterized protein [Ganoderma boninense]